MDAEARRSKILASKEARMSKITGILSHNNTNKDSEDILKNENPFIKETLLSSNPITEKETLFKKRKENLETESKISNLSISSDRTTIETSAKTFNSQTFHILGIFFGALVFSFWSYFLNFDTFDCRMNIEKGQFCFMFKFSYSVVFLSIFSAIELTELLMDRIRAKSLKQLLGEIIRDFCLYLLISLMFNKSLM